MKRAALAQTPIFAPHAGLCETCTYQDACGLRPDFDPPVVFCEEFCPDETGQRRKLAAVRLQSVAAPDPDLELESVEMIGLCKSCANRNRCTLRKPAGGVWHCEEFA